MSKPKRYKMVAGKSVTSRKGLLYGDDELKPELFHEGRDTLEKLIKRGLVEEIKPDEIRKPKPKEK